MWAADALSLLLSEHIHLQKSQRFGLPALMLQANVRTQHLTIKKTLLNLCGSILIVVLPQPSVGIVAVLMLTVTLSYR